MTDDLPEKRTGHPYVMYDMLKDVPAGIKATIEQTRNAEVILEKGPFYFTGNGTAFHSAIAGAQIASSNDERIRFIQAYELERFWNPSGTIIAYSHTGKTKSTVDALRKHAKQNYTIGVSHYSGSPLMKYADKDITIGNSPDLSLCNTKAFFDNAFNAAILTSEITGIQAEVDEIADMISSAGNSLDSQAKSITDELNDIDSIFVLGAGPDYVFARESAQKLREATHLKAEGIELEEFNHGCTAVMDDKTLLVIACNDVVKERVSDIVRASREVKSKTVVLNGEGDITFAFDTPDDIRAKTLLNVLAAYFLGYHLAVGKGVNPDFLRFEDERYLKYDSIVFPPGAH